MRLRYFHIRNYPPLNDLEITFSEGSPLNTNCAIHFVVGVNGSGKTHLLQALMETFICMESKQSPRFEVTLIYELGETGKKQSYLFHNDKEQGTHWWQSGDDKAIPQNALLEDFQQIRDRIQQNNSTEWKALIVDNGWPGSDIGLPSALLAYTTGLPEGWHQLFTRPSSVNSLDLEEEPEEYPPGWTIAHQMNRDLGNGITADTPPDLPLRPQTIQETEVCRFITPLMLKLAVVAVTLNQALDETARYKTADERVPFIQAIRDKVPTHDGLRDLLSQVGWVWPVSLVIECQPSDDVLRETDSNNSATQFWKAYLEAATTVLTDFGVGRTRRIVFDVDNRQKEDKLKKLFDLSESPFSIFRQLLRMHHDGMLDSLTIALRKADTDDILLFDELSDGEQMYLGRMALFHLLENQDDALLLLDEPETHFNDRWKRDLVDIIDQVIGKQANHVLISTHSGITLTDVFTDEITVIEKDEFGNPKQKSLKGIHTFGATPDHPLRDVFGAPGTVGKRASALLDILLLCEPNQFIAEQLWHPDTDFENRKDLIDEFVASVNSVPEFKNKYSSERIKTILKILRQVANERVDTPTVRAVAKYFADEVGPGYYQFDLYQAVYELTGKG